MHIFEKTGVKDRFELAVQGRKLLGLDVPAVQPVAQSATQTVTQTVDHQGPRSEDLVDSELKYLQLLGE